jgi:hypothetical protein
MRAEPVKAPTRECATPGPPCVSQPVVEGGMWNRAPPASPNRLRHDDLPDGRQDVASRALRLNMAANRVVNLSCDRP